MALTEKEAEILPIINHQEDLNVGKEEQEENEDAVDFKKHRESFVKTKVYKQRWWVLALFSFASFTQATVWNTWGPVTESSESVFGWHDSTIGMFANVGNIAYMIFVLPLCWFMDFKGLRISMLGCTFMLVIATGIRCISSQTTIATWMAFICAFLNGVAGVVPFAGPALLASIWYPPQHRATATAIASFFNYFGVAMSFIFGPRLVPYPQRVNNITYHRDHQSDSTIQLTASLSDVWGTVSPTNATNSTTVTVTNVEEIKTGIMHLLYTHAGMAALLFILTVIYFPDKPPTPPSISASIQRTSYMKGLSRLLRSGPVWLIVLAYAIPAGVLGVWASVLDVNVNHLGIEQIQAGWMGFWQTLAGCTAGLIIARFSDLFMRRMKLFLIVLFICGILSTAWFTCLCNNYIPYSDVALYASCILIGIFINGTVPLFYEISCEASYPIAEGVTGGFLTLVNNMFGIIFLCMLLIPGIGHAWMNWCLLGATVVALPLLFLFPERYRRTDLDIEIIVSPPDTVEVNETEEEKIENSESSPLLVNGKNKDM